MKRAMLMATFALSLTIGASGAYAFPSGPCIQPAAQAMTHGLPQAQLFWLLLTALARPIV